MKKVLFVLGVIFLIAGVFGLFGDKPGEAIAMLLLGAVLTFFFRSKNSKPQMQQSVVTPISADIPNFVAFDFETTGLDANTCDIIQAGAVRYINGVEADSFNRLANPGTHISAKITEITGLTDADVKDAASPDEVISDLVSFINGLPLVAHNAPFDLKFLKKYVPNYQPRVYDTLKMSRDASPGGSHKLGDLMEKYGIEGSWHDALSDCRAAAKLFLILYTPDTEPYRKGRKKKEIS